jgi:HAD superfamily hydrolase (TIGR01450 family)
MSALRQAKGFVLDLDGTLIQRTRTGLTPIAGARELLEAIRGSGRPFVIFTNASHVAPSVLAAELRDDGLDVRDDEVLTPVCCAISLLGAGHPGAHVLAFSTPATHERLAAAGVRLVEPDDSVDVVFVAHPSGFDFADLEHAARAITSGAPLLTASYVPAYAGADGPIFSRGAMVTAALAKVTGARPAIVGKPSRVAVREIVARLGLPSRDLAVIGDDVALDISLGNLGRSHTVLVRTGITGDSPLDRLPALQQPDESVAGVDELVGRI